MVNTHKPVAVCYKNDNGRLFLRSNEEFVEDMKHFRKHGELRDLTPGVFSGAFSHGSVLFGISRARMSLLESSKKTANRYLLVFDFEDGHCDRFTRVLASQRYAAPVVCFPVGLDV